MKTTLNKIKAHHPCIQGWKQLLKHLGKTKADDEPLSLLTVLDSNGLDDAIWCMRAIEGRDKEIRLYAVWCARQVQHLKKDPRSLAALDVAERYANGEATKKELAEVWAAARDAASYAASAKAMTAARDAASAAVWDAASAAALAAASDAVWDVTRAAAWDVARDAARAAQEARLREVCNEAQGEDK